LSTRSAPTSTPPSSLVEKLWVHPQPVRAIAREVWAATANALREKNTNFHFTPPKDFDAARHFGDSIGLYVGGKPFRFKVRVAKEIAPWITEVRWHPAQKLEALKNGDVILDLPAGSLIEAKRFVLSLGRFGKALRPKELVGEMREEAQILGDFYPRRLKKAAGNRLLK
jgi:WYL domain